VSAQIIRTNHGPKFTLPRALVRLFLERQSPRNSVAIQGEPNQVRPRSTIQMLHC
jgi:hypothetical protein